MSHRKNKAVFCKHLVLVSTKMPKLIFVVVAIMLHVLASQPLEINVEVTVNGVNQPERNSELLGLASANKIYKVVVKVNDGIEYPHTGKVALKVESQVRH